MVTGIANKTNQPDVKTQGETHAADTRATGAEGHTEAPEMLSRKEVDALLGKAGGKIKAERDAAIAERDSARAERDQAKKSLDSLNGELAEAKTSVETLQNELEEMAKDDPDRTKVAKLIRERQAEVKSLKDEKAKLDGSRKEYEQWQRDQLVYTVADEFTTADGSDVDFDTFMAAANRLKASDRDGLVAVAETMGLKVKTDEETEAETTPKAPKPYSGKSEGGTPYFTRAQIADRTFWLAHKDAILKAQKEGRIRD